MSFDVLKEILAHHGFHTAANVLKPYEVRVLSDVIRSWDNYPACMDVYPKQLRTKFRLSDGT